MDSPVRCCEIVHIAASLDAESTTIIRRKLVISHIIFNYIY